jgi:hypothetical protein
MTQTRKVLLRRLAARPTLRLSTDRGGRGGGGDQRTSTMCFRHRRSYDDRRENVGLSSSHTSEQSNRAGGSRGTQTEPQRLRNESEAGSGSPFSVGSPEKDWLEQHARLIACEGSGSALAHGAGGKGVAAQPEQARGRPQVWAQSPGVRNCRPCGCGDTNASAADPLSVGGRFVRFSRAPPQPAACANRFASSLAAAPSRAAPRAQSRAESQRAPANVCARWKKKSFWCIYLFIAGLGCQPVT